MEIATRVVEDSQIPNEANKTEVNQKIEAARERMSQGNILVKSLLAQMKEKLELISSLQEQIGE